MSQFASQNSTCLFFHHSGCCVRKGTGKFTQDDASEFCNSIEDDFNCNVETGMGRTTRIYQASENSSV